MGHTRFCQTVELSSRIDFANCLHSRNEPSVQLSLLPAGKSVHLKYINDIQKHVSKFAWNEVTNVACVAYSFVQNEHSKESAFFLMFG